MKKCLLWSGGILAIIIAAFLWFISPALNYQYMFSNPFKVTDPGNPDFDPEKFDFNDYKSHEDLANALRVLFPVGTPRSKVDEVLIKSGKASYKRESIDEILRKSKLPGWEKSAWGHGRQFHGYFDGFNPAYRVIYRRPGSIKKFTWVVTAYFDKTDKLMLMIAYMTIVHPDVLNIDKEI